MGSANSIGIKQPNYSSHYAEKKKDHTHSYKKLAARLTPIHGESRFVVEIIPAPKKAYNSEGKIPNANKTNLFSSSCSQALHQESALLPDPPTKTKVNNEDPQSTSSLISFGNCNQFIPQASIAVEKLLTYVGDLTDDRQNNVLSSRIGLVSVDKRANKKIKMCNKPRAINKKISSEGFIAQTEIGFFKEESVSKNNKWNIADNSLLNASNNKKILDLQHFDNYSFSHSPKARYPDYLAALLLLRTQMKRI